MTQKTLSYEPRSHLAFCSSSVDLAHTAPVGGARVTALPAQFQHFCNFEMWRKHVKSVTAEYFDVLRNVSGGELQHFLSFFFFSLLTQCLIKVNVRPESEREIKFTIYHFTATWTQ